MSKLKIYLSLIAEQQFENLCDYLATEWSDKSKNDFVGRLDEKFNQISTQPKSSPESENMKGLRKAVVDRRSSFLYRIHKQSIEVLTIYDNRQSEDTVKKKIKNESEHNL